MVDRGGLNYPIRARDEFSKVTKSFRTEINASKKSFTEFQKVLKGGGKGAAGQILAQAKAVRELAKAQAALGRASKTTTKPLTDEEKALRALAAAAKKQAALERESTRLRKSQEADRRRHLAALEKERRATERAVQAKEREAKASRKLRDSLNPEIQARKQNARAALQEATAIERRNQARQARSAAFSAGDFRGFTQANKQVKSLNKSIRGTDGAATNLLFTFRRLVGTLAIFTAARRAFQAFTQIVKAGVAFNDNVATAQLGIAGLVITLGDVRNAAGETVDNTERLALALGIARQQTALLRQDSLKTVATFEQLLDTFQVSVGPGLAAGLDLDEVRQLTVDISQAASALGVPQNQLAEEVRSLLSGTIQARTTRIATALGISNEDVRRLKETGELFDTLEEKFSGFAEAAEKQARSTFSGISTLLKGLFQEVLGASAKGLFQELIALGNQVFDALSITEIVDGVKNIRPNPEAVAAFQKIFDALKRATEAASALGSGSVLGVVDSLATGIAFTIDLISGIVVGLVGAFNLVRDVISEIADFLNLTSEKAGVTAFTFGKVAVQALLILKAVKLINVNMIRGAVIALRWLAPFVAVAKALEFIFSKVTGVNLNLKDTIEIVAVSLFDAFGSVGDGVATLALNIVTFLENAIDKIITAAKNKGNEVKGFLNALFGRDEAAQADAKARQDREFASEQRIAKRKKEFALEIADIELTAAARKLAVEQEIAKIIGDRAGENAKGEGFVDPTQPLGGVPGAGGITPGPEQGANGAGGAQLFGRARIDDNLLKKANEMTVVLEAQAVAERAKTDAILGNVNAREMALVAAQSAVALAEAELATLEKKNAAELAPFEQQRESLAQDSVELANLNEFITALERRQGFETEILRLRKEQLKASQAEAELVANGSLTDGLQAGFQQFADEFSSTYNAGLEIAKQGTAALAAFASQAIVDAFDPTKEVDLKERFARLMQSIAQTILQQLIQLAIAKAILGFKDGGVVPELNAGGIPLSFAKGGEVPEHSTRRAQGLAGGGIPKPSHIPASDTVPAWLTPGEFVLNKKAVDNLGLSSLEAMNGGSMNVVGSSSAEAAGPSAGMAAGGLVSDQIANAGGNSGESTQTVVVPAIVARDGEMDKLTAGGRNAMLAFMRENAGNINSLLDRSNGRG